jgi:hypothetical protein
VGRGENLNGDHPGIAADLPILGPRHVAGAYLGRWLAHRVMGPVLVAVTQVGDVHDLRPDRIWTHRDENGRLGRTALSGDVVTGDPAEALGRGTAEVLAPIFDHLRAAAPFGKRGRGPSWPTPPARPSSASPASRKSTGSSSTRPGRWSTEPSTSWWPPAPSTAAAPG